MVINYWPIMVIMSIMVIIDNGRAFGHILIDDRRDVQPRSGSGPGPVQSVQEREIWTDRTGSIGQMYWTETDRS